MGFSSSASLRFSVRKRVPICRVIRDILVTRVWTTIQHDLISRNMVALFVSNRIDIIFRNEFSQLNYSKILFEKLSAPRYRDNHRSCFYSYKSLGSAAQGLYYLLSNDQHLPSRAAQLPSHADYEVTRLCVISSLD